MHEQLELEREFGHQTASYPTYSLKMLLFDRSCTIASLYIRVWTPAFNTSKLRIKVNINEAEKHEIAALLCGKVEEHIRYLDSAGFHSCRFLTTHISTHRLSFAITFTLHYLPTPEEIKKPYHLKYSTTGVIVRGRCSLI